MPLILREQKGIPLTGKEVDENFLFLQEKISELYEQKEPVEKFDSISWEEDGLIIQGSKGSHFGPLPVDLSVKPKGHWESNTLYEKNSMVQYGHKLYLAAQSHHSKESFSEETWSLVFDASSLREEKVVQESTRVANIKQLPPLELGSFILISEEGKMRPAFCNGQEWVWVNSEEPVLKIP